jgi:uncharacterized membrane protein
LPYCTNCGTSVDSGAGFCHNCGAPQPRRAHHDFLDGIGDRTANILCYIPVFGIIPAIVFLASQRFRGNSRVRFNAFQSLYLFVAWLIVSSAVPAFVLTGAAPWGPTVVVTGVVKLAFFICWIYLLVKAANHQEVRLPIIGDLAARSIAEQL